MREFVVGFMRDEDLVLLIEKKRPPQQAGELNGVGGHIEAGETALSAMVREFREETGIETTISDWHEFCVISHEESIVHFFWAYGDPSKFKLKETDERLYVMNWHQLSSGLRQIVIPNLTWLIPMSWERRLQNSYVLVTDKENAYA